MSVRSLSVLEMLALPVGTQAVIIKEPWYSKDDGSVISVGTRLTRVSKPYDDENSVAFEYEDGDYDYFTDGTVGVVEVDRHPLIVRHTHLGATLEQTERPAEELGVFRPDLETRKVGKVRVELVDEGFPLALREVAQVMTWAQTAKGYKDHDWQNLPDAEVALAAAASRHRTDHIKQRVVDGFDIVDCVDGESGLLHKAHEAFGVLAQLELMLRGKFVDSRPQIGV